MASLSGIGANVANQDTFLQLLVAQFQNQNPLEPVSDRDFIAQLAQFNTLSSLQSLNASFDQLLRLSGFQVNARTVTAANEVLQELASIIR